MSYKIYEEVINRRLSEQLSGYVEGSIKFAGPPDTPAQARVQLFKFYNAHNQIFPGNTIISWALTDFDGVYRFENLDPNTTYGIVAYDVTGQYDPVIKMNLVPTVD